MRRELPFALSVEKKKQSEKLLSVFLSLTASKSGWPSRVKPCTLKSLTLREQAHFGLVSLDKAKYGSFIPNQL